MSFKEPKNTIAIRELQLRCECRITPKKPLLIKGNRANCKTMLANKLALS